MLKLGQSGGQDDVEGTSLFEFFCKMPCDEYVKDAISANANDSFGAPNIPSIVKPHPYAFEETFCATYEMLDDMWLEDPPANILFFNTLLQV